MDSEDSTKTLSGAQFTIYTDSTCNTSYTTVTTGEDGTVTVTLPVGQTYYMKETKAPEGYQIADTTVYELKTENNSSEGILSKLWLGSPAAGRKSPLPRLKTAPSPWRTSRPCP